MPGRSVVVNVGLNPAGLIAGARAGGAALRDFGSEFDKAAEKGGKGFDELAAGAAVAGGAMLLGFGMAVKSAMEFDKQMSHVGAAANATGKDLQALRQSALEAGAATSFSAKEAAKGQEELAKAGVSVKDILGGGLKGALDLAAAGTLEVGEAAEIAATALTQFKLKGSDVPHIADLLSAGANKAQGSVHDLGMALKQGGLVAAQYGLSVEETTGTLAAFAKAGLIGSDAGTSLKTALLMLGNPTEKSAALMKQLGISAYDASGNFVGMAALAGQLRDKLSGLTQEQRNAALATIFGADAVRGASVLYDNGAAGIKKWTAAVDDSGNAGRTAAAKMDNLAGDLEKLKGSLETALIQTGSQSTGVLRTLTQAGEGMVDTFVGLPGPLQSVVTITGLLVGGALAAAGAYGVMAPKVAAASAALVGMGAAGRVANTALVGAAKGAGKAFTAFAALQIVGAVAGNFAGAAPNVERLSKELEKFAETGKSSGEMTRVFEKDLKRLHDGIEFVRNSGGMKGARNAAGIEGMFGLSNFSFSVSKHIEEIASLDSALASLVTSGNADGAAAAVKRLGLSSKEAGDFLPSYSAALADAADASAGSGSAMEKGAQQAKSFAGGMADAVKEAGSLADALSGLNDVNMSAFEAGNQYQIGLNGMTAALRENKGAWFGASTAAVENRQIVGDQIKTAQDFLGKQHAQTMATRGQAAADAEATTAHGKMRTEMINAAVAAGINRGAVIALIDQLFRVPKDTKAQVTAPGAVPSRGQVADFRREAERIKATYITTIAAHGTAAAAASINNAKAAAERAERTYFINIVTRRTTLTLGPQISGPGSRIDRSRWGNVYSFAGGGVQAKVAGPGTLYQWAEPETGGEAFIPRLGDPRRSRAILETAAGWYGIGLVPAANGLDSDDRTRSGLGGAPTSYLASGRPAAAPVSYAGAAVGASRPVASPGVTQVMQPIQLVVDGRVLVETMHRYEHSNGKEWRTR